MSHDAVPFARQTVATGISLRHVATALLLLLTLPVLALGAAATLPVLLVVCLAEAVRKFYFIEPQRRRSGR